MGNLQRRNWFAKSATSVLMVSAQLCSVLAYTYDSWDWESDFVWTPQVNEVMAKLKATPFIFNEKGVLQFDADKAVKALDLKRQTGVER